MAHPRRIVPGATYLLTRRCSQRILRLRPSPATKHIFMYCLARAMHETGVLVHAVCVMSNHHHMVVTDPHGVLPNFLRELHRLTAKAMNASQGQWENFWAAGPCSVVRLARDEDVEDKIAYVAANPVAAGLVQQPEAWPGFIAWGERSFTVRRPDVYFAAEGSCPAELELRITRPPSLDERAPYDVETWNRRVRGVLTKKVTSAHQSVRRAGRVFLGRAAVLAASSWEKASSFEKRWSSAASFAALRAEVREELHRIETEFRCQYRSALEMWRAGTGSGVFPFGTWWMRTFPGITIEAS